MFILNPVVVDVEELIATELAKEPVVRFVMAKKLPEGLEIFTVADSSTPEERAHIQQRSANIQSRLSHTILNFGIIVSPTRKTDQVCERARVIYQRPQARL